jgi:hypothetical protein
MNVSKDWTRKETPAKVTIGLYHFVLVQYLGNDICLYKSRVANGVFDVQTRDRANRKPRVLPKDGFGTHETLDILKFCFENTIILYRFLSHAKLHPCDVTVFAPL